jgi:hypothetical protein
VPREILPIRPKRLDRARRVQAAQHGIAALLLILNGYAHLTDPHHHDVALPILEIAAGTALILTAIVEKVRKTHARVGWLELAGAAMMYVEAFAKLRERHHFSFYVLSFIPPTIILLFGLFDARIRAGTRLEANDDAFLARFRLIRGHRVPWDTLRAYRLTPTHLELLRNDDRVKRLKLSGLHDREAVDAWLVDQFTRRGVPAAGQTPSTPSAG